jgi:hypothetical protein
MAMTKRNLFAEISEGLTALEKARLPTQERPRIHCLRPQKSGPRRSVDPPFCIDRTRTVSPR